MKFDPGFVEALTAAITEAESHSMWAHYMWDSDNNCLINAKGSQIIRYDPITHIITIR